MQLHRSSSIRNIEEDLLVNTRQVVWEVCGQGLGPEMDFIHFQIFLKLEHALFREIEQITI